MPRYLVPRPLPIHRLAPVTPDATARDMRWNLR